MGPSGNYNPHTPYILGQEWVPIRDEDVAFSPVINSVERGVTFVQPTSQQFALARFYVNTPPADAVFYQVAQVNLYPAGSEEDTGPIQQVIIPCKGVTATGLSIANVGGGSYTDSLYQPGDNKYVTFNYPASGGQAMSFRFDVNSYPVLANKRILNVSFVYVGSVQDTGVAGTTSKAIDFVHPDDGSSLTVLTQMNDAGSGQQFLAPAIGSNTGTLSELNTVVGRGGSARDDMSVAYVDLGDINNCWNSASLGSIEKLPWRYAELLRFEPGFGANRQELQLSVGIPLTPNGFPAGTGNDVLMTLEYVALRVIYCEETRIAYGGQQFQYNFGNNDITMRSLAQASNPTIAPGTYLPTLSFVSMGQVGFGGNLTSDFPKINATRQLYEIPSHAGVEVNIPFPLTERLGEEFTSKHSDILPQISFMGPTTFDNITTPHVYGRQAAAQVYGSNTATQEIYDGAAATAASYPQVRFYARRFGDTTIPLSLANCGDQGLLIRGSGATASTPDAASLDIVGNIELTADVALDNWFVSGTSAVQTLLAKADSIAQFAYKLSIQADGFPQVAFNFGLGSVASVVALAPVVPGPCGRLAVKATINVNNGSGQSVFTFYTAPTAAGPFVQLGATQTLGVFAIAPTTSTLTVGNNGPAGAPFMDEPAQGRHYFAEVRNGIGGTVVANPNFNIQPVGTTSFVDTATPPKTWTLNGTAAIVAANTGASASIAVADFDALVEILDGWREVTLRFAGPPTIGGPVPISPAYTWSAAGETAGNRWEILAASAPAFATVSGSFFTQVLAAQRLGNATYQPPAGAAINLTWMPQGVASVWVTGATPDQGTDAVLILSQDPPTVTGVALTARTQAVTGFALDCGTLPCCIPTGIAYSQVTWSASTLPATGFGAYELQRLDTVGLAWETIMRATDLSVVSFNDYESRVGLTSVYRIRALNALNFAGAWSSQVSGSPPTPGVTGGCPDMTGALIFTSNTDQTGANNAAYVMQWEGTPVEDFSLPEAEMVTYQPMYGRDGSVAFHGTERGLETFNRTVLIHAAALPPVALADAKTIRDLAWADLPYVCVRDDVGDRWYSSVRVPAVSSQLNRTKYLGRIEIVETTRTPYPVDP